MPYMTILHWIAVVVFVLIFFILAMLSLKEKNSKVRNAMFFSALLITILGGISSLFILDKYTKKGKILTYNQKRILSTESVVFSGKVQNVGKFKIGECSITVKLSNNAMKMGRPKNAFFKPSSSFDFLFSKKKNAKPNVVEEEFVVAKNLSARSVKDFRIQMKYPPYMNAPGLKLSLDCH